MFRRSVVQWFPLMLLVLVAACLLAVDRAAAAPNAVVQTDTRSGPGYVTVTWIIPGTGSAPTGYKVKYGTSSGNYTATVDVGKATQKTITGLSNGTTYYFVVTAYDSAGESANSNEKTGLPVASNTLLLSDNFDDGNYNGWTKTTGVWSAASGKLDGYGKVINGSDAYNNYAVEAEVTPKAAGKPVGVLARYVDENNFYFMVLKDDNRVRLYRNFGGTKTELVNRYYPVQLNTAYTMKLVVDGYTLKGYVNGQFVILADDIEFSTGKLGVYAEGAAGVDNLFVTSVPRTFENPSVSENVYRQEELLSGWWNFTTASGVKRNMRVPDCWRCSSTVTGTTGTYERYFDVPSDFTDRVMLDFEQVTEWAQVYMNGTLVGEHKGEGVPFTIDITDNVTVGSTGNLLKVIVSKGDQFYPYGWNDREYDLGIRGEVWLRSVPNVYISDIFVRPSVQNSEITFETTIVNRDSADRTVSVENAVYNDGVLKKSFAAESGITVNAGQSKTITFTRSWTDAITWWPDAPYLYDLVSVVNAGGTVLDRKEDVRFGFREISIVGTQYQLNGVRLNLRGDSIVSHGTRMALLTGGFQPQDYYLQFSTYARTIDTINRYKSMNVNVLRTHMGPAQQYFYDAADELGMLIIDESAYYGSAGFQPPSGTDEDGNTGLSNFENWMKQWVIGNRNHPSIIQWSSSNEAESYPYHNELNNAIRNVDPTRPVSKDSINNCNHNDDTCVKHYQAYNSHNGTGIPPSGNIWSYSLYSTTKPSGEGEFSWNLGTMSHGMALNTRGYRYAGFADVRPYRLTRMYMDKLLPYHEYAEYTDAMEKSMNAVAVFDKQYDNLGIAPSPLPTVLGGAAVTRRLIVFNDEYSDTNVTVEWEAKMGTSVVASGSVPRTIALGDHVEFDISFTAPTVSSDQTLELTLRSKKGGMVKFSDTKRFTISNTLPAEIVLDDGDMGYSDSNDWTVSTAGGGYDGDYKHDGNTGTSGGKWAIWQPGTLDGTYEVSLFWKAYANRASNAKVRIYHVNGSLTGPNGKYDEFTVNMQQGDTAVGEWHQVGGTFVMDAGDYVGIINDGANGFVIADAVKFVRQ